MKLIKNEIDTQIERIEDALETNEIGGQDNPGEMNPQEEADERQRLRAQRFFLRTARTLYQSGHVPDADALLGYGPAEPATAARKAFESFLEAYYTLTPEQAAQEFDAALNTIRNTEKTT